MSWTMKDLLLKGAPWEVLPEDRPKVEKAARRYSKDPTLSKRDRDYIERIWLPQEEPQDGAQVYAFRTPRMGVPDDAPCHHQPPRGSPGGTPGPSDV